MSKEEAENAPIVKDEELPDIDEMEDDIDA